MRYLHRKSRAGEAELLAGAFQADQPTPSSTSTSTSPMQTSTWSSLLGVPPAEKLRRQIEAG
jgi:hypothetical protein